MSLVLTLNPNWVGFLGVRFKGGEGGGGGGEGGVKLFPSKTR